MIFQLCKELIGAEAGYVALLSEDGTRNELVSNSLKHAFPDGRAGKIALLSSRRENGQVVLEVSDTGTGIPAALLSGEGTTTGLQLVGILCEQLGGTAEISGKRGTRTHPRSGPDGHPPQGEHGRG